MEARAEKEALDRLQYLEGVMDDDTLEPPSAGSRAKNFSS